MNNEDQNKATDYFSATRFDIRPALPALCESVLEIGCGSGATLAWLKDSGYCKHTTGIELVAQQADIAEKVVDRLIQGSIDDMDLASWPERYDLILCLDVLEHLSDPWGLIEKLDYLLKPGGRLVASIPNIRHVSVLLPLLFKGEWKYRERGILDKTHLRFFTRQSAMEMMVASGLTLVQVHALGMKKGSQSRVLNKLTLGVFQDFFASQYLVAVEKKPQGSD